MIQVRKDGSVGIRNTTCLLFAGEHQESDQAAALEVASRLISETVFRNQAPQIPGPWFQMRCCHTDKSLSEEKRAVEITG